jgi:hypothetical protein
MKKSTMMRRTTTMRSMTDMVEAEGNGEVSTRPNKRRRRKRACSRRWALVVRK